jgi:hypothetical protein
VSIAHVAEFLVESGGAEAFSERPRVFFDITVGGTKAGRVVFELVSSQERRACKLLELT